MTVAFQRAVNEWLEKNKGVGADREKKQPAMLSWSCDGPVGINNWTLAFFDFATICCVRTSCLTTTGGTDF